MNVPAIKQDEFEIGFNDLDKVQKMCQSLLKTPHYAKMGDAGVFAIVQKAKTLGMNPLDALNGGLYFVSGKVEMSGQAMMALIRKAGHSIRLDPQSTTTSVIMHGKRCDNGDEWRVSFSIEDAKRAGIYKSTWEKYPQTMCIWRCVSMLGRFLFSDVLKGAYVEGEIRDALPIMQEAEPVTFIQPVEEKITESDLFELCSVFEKCRTIAPEWCTTVEQTLHKQGVQRWLDMPKDTYDRIIKKASQIVSDYETMNGEEVEAEAVNA
jgi:hypothetical protein